MTHPRLPHPVRPARRQRGIALLESLLAILLLAIGLIGTIGLQARSVAALADASQRAEAAIAANKLIGLMNTDIANIAAYRVSANATPPARLLQWHQETLRLIPGATIFVGVTAGIAPAPSVVNIEIRWRRKANAPLNTHSITSYLAGSV